LLPSSVSYGWQAIDTAKVVRRSRERSERLAKADYPSIASELGPVAKISPKYVTPEG